MSSNKEMWLSCNDMGIWNMQHEGDYDREDTLLHITVDETGSPTIRVVNPK
jgi:hypothetical protein